MIQEQITFLSEKVIRLNIRISEAEINDEDSGRVSISAYTKHLKEEVTGYNSILKLLKYFEDAKPCNRNMDVEIAFMCNEVSDLNKRILNAKKLVDNNKGTQGSLQALGFSIDAMQKEHDHLVAILEYIKQAVLV